jgi:hypothetical protein
MDPVHSTQYAGEVVEDEETTMTTTLNLLRNMGMKAACLIAEF